MYCTLTVYGDNWSYSAGAFREPHFLCWLVGLQEKAVRITLSKKLNEILLNKTPIFFQENYKVFEIFWWHCPFKYFNLIAAFSWDYVQKMNPRLLYTVYVKPIVCLIILCIGRSMYMPTVLYTNKLFTVHSLLFYFVYTVQYLFELFDGPVDFQSVCRNAGKTLSRSYKNKTTFLQQQHNIYSQQLMQSKNCVYKKLIPNQFKSLYGFYQFFVVTQSL